jgi:putative PIN family toxin of toxin-antitoxin system
VRTIVVDTDVFVAALLGPGGAAREVVRRCLLGTCQPLMGVALFLEYETVFGRTQLWEKCPLTVAERKVIAEAFMQSARWVEVYFGWRPNLRDESDNHLIELAVAGNAEAIVTRNKRDFVDAELKFPNLRVLSPAQFLKERSCQR